MKSSKRLRVLLFLSILSIFVIFLSVSVVAPWCCHEDYGCGCSTKDIVKCPGDLVCQKGSCSDNCKDSDPDVACKCYCECSDPGGDDDDDCDPSCDWTSVDTCAISVSDGCGGTCTRDTTGTSCGSDQCLDDFHLQYGYVCFGPACTHNEIHCPYGCSDGACKPCPPSCVWTGVDMCVESISDGCGGTCFRPTEGISCGSDTCIGNMRYYDYTCRGGTCNHLQTDCEYGCYGRVCVDPDDSETSCENNGLIWMPSGGGGTNGKCCGDDPSGNPPTKPDSGRVLNSATPEHHEWLCTVPAGGPVVTQSKGIRGEIVAIPGMASDALSSGTHWYVCDSNKDSDGRNNFDHMYDNWNGRRVDDTCRYPINVGFFCGQVNGSDLVMAAASTGTPSLITDTVDSSDDGKWYNYYGILLAGPGENIGRGDSPLKVTLSGLDPASNYVVTIELANDAQGNNFYVRIGDSGTYKQLGAKYNPWPQLVIGTVTGVAETSVQFYYAGGATIRMAVRNIRAVKEGVPYAEQRPVVELDRDYICGTGLVAGGQTLTGERFVECCGAAGEVCKTGQVLHTGDMVTVGDTTWVCANDKRLYDQGLVDSDMMVCELLGYTWSGDLCCGNDPGEQPPIWSWRGEQAGCCYSSSGQCLVDNAGSSLYNNLPDTFFTTDKGPHCIDDTQYVLNHFCDAGTWRSMNKGLADKLLDFVKDKDPDHYVIFCDDYKNALAYYDYITLTNNPLEDAFLVEESCQSGSKNYPCFNTFCVAAAPDEGFAVVGGSFNYPKNVSHVEELVGEEDGICGEPDPGDDYEDCGGSGWPIKRANLWFSAKEQSFIYSSERISVGGGGLWGWLKSNFDAFFSWLMGKHALATEVVHKADTYEKFYVLVSGGGAKTVFGREEGVYTADGYDSILAVDFTGFSSSSEFCARLAERYPGTCEDAGGGSKYLAAVKNDEQQAPLFELWQYLTSSLRVS